MFIDELFNFSPTAQLALSADDDGVLAVNMEACRLFKVDSRTLCRRQPSAIFSRCFPEFIVFTQQLVEQGSGWTDALSVVVGENALRIEMNGRAITNDQGLTLILSMQPISVLDELRGRSDADWHYKTGIPNWQRVARVFQEFERENQLLLDAAGEGIYGVDAKGNTTFLNPAAQRILEYSAEELAGKNMHNMVHHSHPDGTHFHSDRCPIFKAFHEGEVQSVEGDVFWTKSRKAIDVDYTSTPIYDDGIIVGAVVIFRDVSQKKAAEKKLREALLEVQVLKDRLELENAYLQEEINSEFYNHQIIGKSDAIKTTIQQLELVAPTSATVLIYGESGTGKELIARAIHEMSDRSNRSLIRVNCAAIPEDLFESEFFGHVKGAFSGAISDRVGRFELADGGSLFLDEVGEIPLQQQGKLLRVLQEQQFERVGDEKTRAVDVRIIAATNRDLKELVEAGEFREDLYFRLNVFPIESAPLRKRREDIPLLTQLFVDRFSKKFKKSDLRLPLVEMERLKAYRWPGNVRELENVIERQVILARGNILRFDFASAIQQDTVTQPPQEQQGKILTEVELQRIDRVNIIRALSCAGGKVSGSGGAAELLGLKSTTLESRIKRYKILKRAQRDAC